MFHVEHWRLRIPEREFGIILVFYDVEELNFVGPLEVFGMDFLRQPNIGCHGCGNAQKGPIATMACGILPSYSLVQRPEFDLWIVPGGPGAKKHGLGKSGNNWNLSTPEGYLASVP